MTGPVPMVEAQQVCKHFGALSVLKGVTLSVQPPGNAAMSAWSFNTSICFRIGRL